MRKYRLNYKTYIMFLLVVASLVRVNLDKQVEAREAMLERQREIARVEQYIKEMDSQIDETQIGSYRLRDSNNEWKKIRVLATAYTAGYESCGKYPDHPAYGITYTGTRATEGRTVAVDPLVIPLGSEVVIPALNGVYIAEDTGRLIKGNRIDIFIEDLQEALEWGVQYIDIYIRKDNWND